LRRASERLGDARRSLLVLRGGLVVFAGSFGILDGLFVLDSHRVLWRLGSRCVVTAGRFDTDARGLLQRGGIGISLGSCLERFERSAPAVVDPISDQDCRALRKNSPQPAHQVTHMGLVCAGAEIGQAYELGRGGLQSNDMSR